MKLEFSEQIFEKSSNIKIHENVFIGSHIVPFGWTDRQTDRWTWQSYFFFKQFCKCAKKSAMHPSFKSHDCTYLTAEHRRVWLI